MRSGTWDGAVSTDNARVTVNGTVRPVASVQIQSGMRDGHPQGESGSWCVEATIDWASPHLVTGESPHPFGGASGHATDWLPKAGDSVVVETGDGATGQWWVQHRGVIDDTTGSLAEGTAQSKTIDAIDDLSGRVSFGNFTSTLPGASAVSAGSGNPRHAGLQSTYLIDRLLRTVQGDTGGWYATPPRTWQTIGSVPAQGSLLPEVGSLADASRRGDPDQGPSWGTSDYGVRPANYTAITHLIGDTSQPILTIGGFGGFTDATSCEALVCDTDGNGAFVGYDYTTDEVIYGTRTSGGPTYRVPRNGVTRAAIFFYRNTTTSQTLTLRLDDGREFTQDPGSTLFPNGWTADRVIVDADAYLGWWMVEGTKPVSQRWATLEHVPTARLRIGNIPWWRASRDQSWIDVAEWLGEQVDAECAAMWLDEDGVMQWAGRGTLENRPVVNTITSDLGLDDVQWESRRSALARSVWLNYKEARINRGWKGAASRTLWSSNTVDVGAGETEVEVINVPEDQDWFGVDLSPHIVSTYGNSWTYFSHGSTYGGTQYRASDSDEQAWAPFVDCTMTRLSLRTFEVSFGAWSTMSQWHRVKTEYPSTTGAFLRVGAATLNLRGQGQTTWIDRERSVNAGTIGPARFTHDVGWRVQDINDAVGSLLSWLAAQVSSTRPRVTNLVIAHDPRHQVGDHIAIEDRHVTGLRITMLIQDRDVDTGDMTETISGRVIAAHKMQDIVGGSIVDRYSLHEPGGPTPITPESDWTRKAV